MSNNSYERKKNEIKNLYRYSDLSFGVIAKQLHMSLAEVQDIINQMIESDALELAIEKSTTHVASRLFKNSILIFIVHSYYNKMV
jgi:energy-converting hydrogenase A subunit M